MQVVVTPTGVCLPIVATPTGVCLCRFSSCLLVYVCAGFRHAYWCMSVQVVVAPTGVCLCRL